MKAIVNPGRNKNIKLHIPCSKSYAHRAIIAATLSDGISKVSNIDYNDDIRATLECVKHLGAKIEEKEHEVIIQGIKNFDSFDNEIINCNESGSTLRFLIPIFSMTSKEVKFIGKGRLLSRPQNIYQEIYDSQNLTFKQTDNDITVFGKLKPGIYEVEGNVSSQFITGLLFTLPLLDGDSRILIKPPFESKSYVKLTIKVLNEFGIDVFLDDELGIRISGNQKYRATDYVVEGDYSSASFFASLGAINNGIELSGLNPKSIQGDHAVIEILKTLGTKTYKTSHGYKIEPAILKPSTIDLADCPDLGPIMFATAATIEGTTKFINTQRLRIKESDRIAAMEDELRKLGVDITSDYNSVTVKGTLDLIPTAEIESHNDHRIVMSLAIIASVANKKVIINDIECINKSYPTFFDDLKKCGIKVTIC